MSETKRHFHDITQEVTHRLAYMRAELPDVMKGFHDLGRAATHAGALDPKTKELIAVALAVAGHCDPCIGFHVKAYVRHGGTKRELAEALGMAVYMGGGPSLMYTANALAAMDEFLEAAQAKAAAAAAP